VIQTQIALLKRELWEHRSLYIAPLVVVLIIALLFITGQAAVSVFNDAIDVALLGASSLGEKERAVGVTILLVATAPLFLITMAFLTVFYSLDSLYAERKDRSILFWRSLPVTDAETVISKLLVGLLVIPLIVVATIMLTHLIVMTITSVWLGFRGADAWHLIWSAAPFFDVWMSTLIFFLAVPLWLSPFIGWFLFVSAFTKRSPFLTAFLPLIILPMLEKILLHTSVLGSVLFERQANIPLNKGLDTPVVFSQFGEDPLGAAASGVSLLSMINVGGFLTSPGLWAGFLVCGLFVAGAVYVRRFRDET